MTFSFRPAKRSEAKPLPPFIELHRLFRYDAQSGRLYRRWRADLSYRLNRQFAFKRAGFVSKKGYVQVGIGHELFLAHRIIWKMAHRTEPPFLDHVDGNPTNNRLSNLREATRSQNLCNRNKDKGKKLPKGVFKNGRKFEAKIMVAGTLHRLGRFESPRQAALAYKSAAKELHREFARV